MRSLYEITGAYLNLMEMMEDPSMDQQAIADTMEGIKGELGEKLEHYAHILVELDMRASRYEAEAKRMTTIAKAIRKNAKNMMDRTYASMTEIGIDTVKTDLFTFKIVNNGGVKPIIYNVTPDKLPEQFRQEVVTVKPDDKVIRAFLDNGNTSDCFQYGERGTHLEMR